MDSCALAAELGLARPLVCLDIEATGVSWEHDRIVEFAAVKLRPSGETTEWVQRFDPGVPIPAEATEIHGISDADVAGCPSFAAKAGAILRALDGCDLAGHNIRGFDIRMLRAEMQRAGLTLPLEGVRVIDTLAIFRRREPRDLLAAVRFYIGEAAAALHAEVAHGALPDARSAMAVLAGQLGRYTDLPRSVDELHAYCVNRQPSWIDEEGKLVWRNREAAIGFGKHRGRPLREVAVTDGRYLTNFVLSGDFTNEVKRLVRDALEGRFPDPPAPPAEV